MPGGKGRRWSDFVHEVAADVVVRVKRAMPELPLPWAGKWNVCGRRPAGAWLPAGQGGCSTAACSAPMSSPRRLITGHLTSTAVLSRRWSSPGCSPSLACDRSPSVARCAAREAWWWDGGIAPRSTTGHVAAGAGGQRGRGCRDGDGTIDLRRQLLSELREELGLPPEAVGESRPLCIVEHPGSHVSDLGLALVTRLSAEAVLAARRAGGNAEYEQMLVVPEAGLAAFLAEVGEALVPPAREFLRRAGPRPTY